MPNDLPLLDPKPSKGEKAPAWTTDQVYTGLKAMYAPPAYALLFEVGNGTGMNKSRSADALAMSLWPSRGLSLLGFEVKASRSDWVKELDDPHKADAIARYCNFWYLVVGRREIVQPGELPPTWGLIAPDAKGEKLKVVVESKPLDPIPVDRGFLAAIFRRTTEKVEREDAVSIAYAKGKSDGYKLGLDTGKESVAWDHKRSASQLADLQKTVQAFEATSGINLLQCSDYHGRSLGMAVKVLTSGSGWGDYEDSFALIGRQAQAIVDLIGKVQAAQAEMKKPGNPDEEPAHA